MSRDFTLLKYRELLEALLAAGYVPVTLEEYCTAAHLPDKYVILRHDVDRLPQNSVRTAEIEHGLGIRASYYFRIVPESNQPDRIRRVAALGHEIGYHYEDLALANGNAEQAWQRFRKNLVYFRTFYPVRTICMHGAPTNRYDGRDLWKNYDYHGQGIVGEPYFDVDFSKVLYLTDTGRCWDGYKVSVRDKIPRYQAQWEREGHTYHTTDEIINALRTNTLPSCVMLTTHPQRWAANSRQWTRELIAQTIKNRVKRVLVYAKTSRH